MKTSKRKAMQAVPINAKKAIFEADLMIDISVFIIPYLPTFYAPNSAFNFFLVDAPTMPVPAVRPFGFNISSAYFS